MFSLTCVARGRDKNFFRVTRLATEYEITFWLNKNLFGCEIDGRSKSSGMKCVSDSGDVNDKNLLGDARQPQSSDIIDNTCMRAAPENYGSTRTLDTIRYGPRIELDELSRIYLRENSRRTLRLAVSKWKSPKVKPADLIGSTQITSEIYGARFSRATGRRAHFSLFHRTQSRSRYREQIGRTCSQRDIK